MSELSASLAVDRLARDETATEMATDEDRPALRALLNRIPADVADSFTPTQLSALDRALHAQPASNSSVDIRVSIPLLWKRKFLIFLLGTERRSPDRRARDRKRRSLLTFANASAFAFFFLFLVPAFMGLGHLLALYLGKFPTSLYWAIALIGLTGAVAGMVLERRKITPDS